VDLHTALIEPGYTFAPAPELAFEASGSVDIAGRAVGTLTPELTFAYLCFHSAKHNWGALSYVVELAALLRNSPPDAGKLAALAGHVGTRRMLGLGLLLAARVGGAALEPALATLMLQTADAGASRAAALAASHWGEPQPYWLNRTRPRSVRSPVLRDEVHWRTFVDPRDLVRLAARVLLRPTAEDWALVELPRRMHSIYVPLRVARLALREMGRLRHVGPRSDKRRTAG
jgi:hypothetical protein